MLHSEAPLPGFADPALQSQAAFTSIMQAMAHPGRIYAAPERITAPAPLNPSAAMVALTLCDYDTPVWLDDQMQANPALLQFLAFHTGAPVTTETAEAPFAFICDPETLSGRGFAQFALGTDAYPDQSATLVLQVKALRAEKGVTLAGPGIKTTQDFTVDGVPADFWDMVAANHALFPRGVDIIFCTDTEIAGLPRSTRATKGD